MEHSRIELTPFGGEDFDRLIAWIDSPRFLLQWAGARFTFPLDRAQLQRHLRSTKARPARSLVFKAIASASGDTIGHGEISNVDLTHRTARLSRILIGPPDLRGRGLGTALLQELLSVVFNDLRLHRVSLGVFEFNEAALRCYERVGFQREGLQRDARRFEGEYWSQYQMGLLEDEWRRECCAPGVPGRSSSRRRGPGLSRDSAPE